MSEHIGSDILFTLQDTPRLYGWKFGILLEISDNGLEFRITRDDFVFPEAGMWVSINDVRLYCDSCDNFYPAVFDKCPDCNSPEACK